MRKTQRRESIRAPQQESTKGVIEINILNKRVTKQMKKAQETHISDDLRICGKMRKI